MRTFPDTRSIRLPRWIVLLITMQSPALLAEVTGRINYNPFETRDQNLLNLVHGQPLPTNAALNAESQSLWSSSLVITNTVNIESSASEDILIDYESYRFNVSYQYGLNDNWNLKLDIPVIYQGSGVFDSAIESWHKFFGLPNGQRPGVERGQYNIDYNLDGQALLNQNSASTSLGDIQLTAARSLMDNERTTMSLWGSLKLPTGSENKLSGNGGVDISAWLALNQRLAQSWRINLNAGAIILGKDQYKDIPLSDYAVFGHVVLSWLVTDAVNLKIQAQGHSSYYDQSSLKILGDTMFMTFGGSININQCNQLDIAISEDMYVEASPDISLLINWRSYTGGC